MLFQFRLKTSGQMAILNLKLESLTLSLDEEEVNSFDGEGRLLTAWKQDRTYVRCLNNRLIKKYWDPAGRFPWKRIEEVQGVEKKRVLHHAYHSIHTVRGSLQQGRVEWYCGEERYRQNPTELSASLELIANWDEPKLEREKERFSALCRPVSILPPDQYFSLVLQATEGCHWNQCRFCSFYAQTPFYIKSAEEFTAHLRAVREFMGRSLGLRRSLFLGDANALVVPQEKLLAFLSIANAEFRVGFPGESREKNREAMEGVYSFLDVFTGTGKKAEDFAALQKMNLKRVYLGVETGSDELLEELRKPSSAGQAREVISDLRKAGLQLGIIILVGVGGKRFYRSHVDSTLRLLNGLPWQEGDILYFSPLWLSEGSRSERESREKGWGPLSPGETLAQWQEIRDQLDFSPCTPPRIALYDIREFVY